MAQILRCLLLPSFALAADCGQFRRANPFDNGPEGGPGLDRLQLGGVADEDELGTGPFNGCDKRRHLLG